MLSNFNLYYSTSEYSCYEYSKEVKTLPNVKIILFTGCCPFTFSDLSFPNQNNLSLDKYSKLSFSVFNNDNSIIYYNPKDWSNEFNDFINKNKIFDSNYLQLHNYDLSVVKFCIEQILLEKKEEVKYGGICSICGSYDDYAPIKNGKCFCYKHFKI